MYRHTNRPLSAAERHDFEAALDRLTCKKYEISLFWRVLNTTLIATVLTAFALAAISSSFAPTLVLFAGFIVYATGIFAGLLIMDHVAACGNDWYRRKFEELQTNLKSILSVEAVDEYEIYSETYFRSYFSARPGERHSIIGFLIPHTDLESCFIRTPLKTLDLDGEIRPLIFQPNTYFRLTRIGKYYFIKYLGKPVRRDWPEIRIVLDQDSPVHSMPLVLPFTTRQTINEVQQNLLAREKAIREAWGDEASCPEDTATAPWNVFDQEGNPHEWIVQAGHDYQPEVPAAVGLLVLIALPFVLVFIVVFPMLIAFGAFR